MRTGSAFAQILEAAKAGEEHSSKPLQELCNSRATLCRLQWPNNRKGTLPEGKRSAADPGERWTTGVNCSIPQDLHTLGNGTK